MGDRTYICIDLKSFYASVECVERGLNPLKTNLVVADPERSDKTICLAVSPAMKSLGVPGRCRVFQIPAGIEYIMAEPRMQLYIDYAVKIYGIYLKYLAKEDIHVYSIDEAFMDVTDYLRLYKGTAKDLSIKIMNDIMKTTGITSTCGIGSNLYLAKVALDILAKHSDDYISILDEEMYQNTLWDYKRLTDFWRIGPGTARRLERMGIFTMRALTEADERILYKEFGIDAELLIDHAWGRETTTIQDIKTYRSKEKSLSNSQVLMHDYRFAEGKLIVKEMTDLLCLEMVEKRLVTNSITLHVGYTRDVQKKSAHGTTTMPITTNTAKPIISHVVDLYEKIVDKQIPIRRVTVCFNAVVDETNQQYDLFTDLSEIEREHALQKALLDIKRKYGKNAVLKGMNLQESATTRERNHQIGGHKSGS